MVDGWQGIRLKRALEQNIFVTRVECTKDDSFAFTVQGVNDVYLVEINENVALWPPHCSCEDNFWRPDILCKHILLCLALMGFDENYLEDCCWEPERHELYEYLSKAPSCVNCSSFSQHGRNNTRTADMQAI